MTNIYYTLQMKQLLVNRDYLLQFNHAVERVKRALSVKRPIVVFGPSMSGKTHLYRNMYGDSEYHGILQHYVKIHGMSDINQAHLCDKLFWIETSEQCDVDELLTFGISFELIDMKHTVTVVTKKA